MSAASKACQQGGGGALGDDIVAHEARNVAEHDRHRRQDRRCIRQHTSAYVSIRPHTSAYVSMCQHTSAHVIIDTSISSLLTDLRVLIDEHKGIGHVVIAHMNH